MARGLPIGVHSGRRDRVTIGVRPGEITGTSERKVTLIVFIFGSRARSPESVLIGVALLRGLNKTHTPEVSVLVLPVVQVWGPELCRYVYPQFSGLPV